MSQNLEFMVLLDGHNDMIRFDGRLPHWVEEVTWGIRYVMIVYCSWDETLKDQFPLLDVAKDHPDRCEGV